MTLAREPAKAEAASDSLSAARARGPLPPMLRGFSFDTLLGTQRKSGIGAHIPKCDCGCVPNVMSLHEAAKERARRRAQDAARKPTVGEVLAMRDQALQQQQQQQQQQQEQQPVQQQQQAFSAMGNMLMGECDDEEDEEEYLSTFSTLTEPVIQPTSPLDSGMTLNSGMQTLTT